jgi:hypothetical protein
MLTGGNISGGIGRLHVVGAYGTREGAPNFWAMYCDRTSLGLGRR